MKFIKQIAGGMVLLLMTGCVVYSPPQYAYRQRVEVQREPYSNEPRYEYRYVEPAYPAPPAVVIDPFPLLLGAWAIHGYFGHSHHGHHYSHGHHHRR